MIWGKHVAVRAASAKISLQAGMNLACFEKCKVSVVGVKAVSGE
jgi:hypothetical protein